MVQPTEQQEQIALATVLDRAGILWNHPPNGGLRNKVTAALLKAMGVKAGVPDVMIYDPPPVGGYIATAVELKVTSGGELSPKQLWWLRALEARGWATCVAQGAREAIEFLHRLGYRL